MPAHSLPNRWRTWAAFGVALCAAVVAACGGGGDAAPAAGNNEQASTYAAGPITGFGSVIVNGVRYDDSAAAVTDDDDSSRGRDALKLGMVVALDASDMSADGSSGRALRIRYGAEIVGPVTAVDAASAMLTVLGQTVVVDDRTVFDSSLSGGLAAIATGSVLEVHGQFDASTGHYAATRIESAAGAVYYRLRGNVADLTATTFTLGGQVIDYSGVAAADLPQGLANGMKVRVRLQTAPDGAGNWLAVSVRTGVRRVEDHVGGHVRGAITVFTSSADFEIDGLKVDATNASFPDGTAGLGTGTVVEVHGKVANGVLVATKVELDNRHAAQRHRFELHGAISSLSTTEKTFLLRGVTVGYAGSVTWKNGAEADLANGRRVEVKGTLSSDRTRLEATEIGFED